MLYSCRMLKTNLFKEGNGNLWNLPADIALAVADILTWKLLLNAFWLKRKERGRERNAHTCTHMHTNIYFKVMPHGNWILLILFSGGDNWGNDWNDQGNIVLGASSNQALNYFKPIQRLNKKDQHSAEVLGVTCQPADCTEAIPSIDFSRTWARIYECLLVSQERRSSWRFWELQ